MTLGPGWETRYSKKPIPTTMTEEEIRYQQRIEEAFGPSSWEVVEDALRRLTGQRAYSSKSVEV